MGSPVPEIPPWPLPPEVVGRAISYVQAGAWDDLAGLIHADGLVRFQAWELKVFAVVPTGWPKGLMGVDSPDALRRVPSRDFFGRWMAATYAGSIPWQEPADRGRFDRAVLGAVREVRLGEILSHVVYRVRDRVERERRVEHTTLRWVLDGWRMDVDLRLLLPVRCSSPRRATDSSGNVRCAEDFLSLMAVEQLRCAT
jgi:hypothetical protein